MGQHYQGRMWTDGNGNLLVYDIDADGLEGPNHGLPVYHNLETDRYEYLAPGEPSHNARYSKNTKDMVMTQSVDPDLPGYAGTEKDPTPDHEHHFEKHIDRSGDAFNTLPDAIASITTGHTAAYEGRGGK